MIIELEIPRYRIANFGFDGPEHLAALAYPDYQEIIVEHDLCRDWYHVKVVMPK